ncbi:MAG: ankyrin repeat domain-containing protein [Candidatus Dependentiae bacterium]|nr:ankyrin repeat domain-containing protein [Candidatus Dependentiae bacterium]
MNYKLISIFSILCCTINVQASDLSQANRISSRVGYNLTTLTKQFKNISHVSDSSKPSFPIYADNSVVYSGEDIDRFVINEALHKFMKYIVKREFDELEFCCILAIFQSYDLNNNETNYVDKIVNYKSKDGETLLHCITNHHISTDTAELLLDYGADPNQQDVSNRTPLDYAIERNNNFSTKLRQAWVDLFTKRRDVKSDWLDFLKEKRSGILSEKNPSGAQPSEIKTDH